ncbi:hypothetical protein [Pimelobacter simplex]|uniref:hypothetical protein n=1 Tax=Nocardioides simplex TaxID=2045 RepID=UPI00214F8650|nr:hypothetical protein [Pimelobacter simplex]UUW89488.1 hypothetical protein M0M43_27725 [Pimelobacter simplex]UUW93317.1 hypothetical protein M0M48_16380 [Pimelobacter simplex]
MADAAAPAMVAVRAAPRLVLLTVLAIGALTSDLDWLRFLAALLFVLNAGRLLSPGWRQWVRTGEREVPASAPAAEPADPTKHP